jgi:predicted nuclease of predicted toxin-antitoxin system
VRFIVDERTGPTVANWLISQGHEVFSIFDQARGIDDESVLDKAYRENWILITNDKDFGEYVYRAHKPHHGIILLRLSDEHSQGKMRSIQKLLVDFADRLVDQFVVVTENQVRFGEQLFP